MKLTLHKLKSFIEDHENIVMFIAAFATVGLAIAVVTHTENTSGDDNFPQSLPRNYIPQIVTPHLPPPAKPHVKPYLQPMPEDEHSSKSELTRCLEMGEAAIRDSQCLQARKQNREHFLGTKTDKPQ